MPWAWAFLIGLVSGWCQTNGGPYAKYGALTPRVTCSGVIYSLYENNVQVVYLNRKEEREIKYKRCQMKKEHMLPTGKIERFGQVLIFQRALLKLNCN